jgi:hypothetical protein
MSADTPPRPACFVAMPFGRKPPPGKRKPEIDFDAVYAVMARAVAAADLDCIRADFEPYGGFIHRTMYERLLLAEFVVADLTFSNPNVAYEVGIRHAAATGRTVLVCEEASLAKIGFDFRPFRILPYRLEKDGSFAAADADAFFAALTKRLREAASDTYPSDNPLLQITSWTVREDIAHSKTDAFLERMRYASDVGQEVAEALIEGSQKALDRLREIETAKLPEKQDLVVVQLHSAFLALFIGYREVEGFEDMVRLFERMPPELKRKAVSREQLALALNRLAEAQAKVGDPDGATTLRQRAIAALDQIPAAERTSETFGIRGRIHKGWSDAEQQAGRELQADAQLKRAIAVYEEGFRLDPRDYYPGVNAVTLSLRRGKPEDLARVETLVPVVRFAVDRAPTPKDETEGYWQCATKLELAAAAKDWPQAHDILTDLLGIKAAGWMRTTTAKNLKLLKDAFAADPATAPNLDPLVAALEAA